MQAVAARDKARAVAYAARHGIPEVKDTYQDILDDDQIDCVYIPLPNGLHYEWTVRALRAGKHVLLEKPSVSNHIEAERLFLHPPVPLHSLASPGPPDSSHPVLLEAIHSRFQPAVHHFLTSVITPELAVRAEASLILPVWYLDREDIRFQYSLSGGAMTDLGAYTTYMLRAMFGGRQPTAVRSAEFVVADWTKEAKEVAAAVAAGNEERKGELVDRKYEVEFEFGGPDRIGRMTGDLKPPYLGNIFPTFPRLEVWHRAAVLDKDEAVAALKTSRGAKGAPKDTEIGELIAQLQDGTLELACTRRAELLNFVVVTLWHRIDIEDEYVLRRTAASGEVAGSGEVRKRWTVKESKKIYTWKDAGVPGKPDKDYWASYRHQLGAFVDRVRGRTDPNELEGVGIWIEPENSAAQLAAIDMAYEKGGLKIRPTSSI